MVRALRRRLSVDARVLPEVSAGAGVPGPDLWCHVLPGPPRAADRHVVGLLPADRLVVVLTKADVYGPVTGEEPPDTDPPDTEPHGAEPVVGFAAGAVVTAERCARDLDRPVIAVSGLWAAAAPTGPQVELLGALAAAGEHVPAIAGHFTTPTGIRVEHGDEEKLRIELLRVMDRRGVDLVTRELAAGRIDPDAGQVAGLLHTASGVGALAEVFAARAPAVAAARTRELAAAAERIAARGHDRAGAELLLAELGRAR